MNLQAVYAKNRFMKLESFVIEVIEKRKKGFWILPLQWFLAFSSQLFKSGILLKNFFYDHKLLKPHKVPSIVISVGNIVAGGTGKTPFISFLASHLPTSKKLAVLSRGYRSKIAHTRAVMEVSNGIGPLYPVDICGDEPFLLSTLIPHAMIIVGRDRVKAAKMAVDLKSKIILLDDGMQYRRIHRDFEVVLLHADDLFGKGAFLPQGYLRDHPKRLATADLIVIHAAKSKDHFSKLCLQIRKYTDSSVIGTKTSVQEVYDIQKKKKIELQGKKVGIFCSIGKPFFFLETVKNLQCTIVDQLFFPDHARFHEEEIQSFSKKCKEKGAEILLCTEKDGVKVKTLDLKALPIAVVKTSLKIMEGEEIFTSFLGMVAKLGNKT